MREEVLVTLLQEIGVMNLVMATLLTGKFITAIKFLLPLVLVLMVMVGLILMWVLV